MFSSKNPEGAEFHGFQSAGEWGFARRASSEARSEELSSATDFSPWVSTQTRFVNGRSLTVYHRVTPQCPI